MIVFRGLAPSFSRLNLFSLSSFILYLVSLPIISLAYQSIEPILVINLFFFTFSSLLYLICGRRNFDDLISTIFIFNICLFWSAIGSIYLNVFDDLQYKGADSGFFLELARGKYFENPILFGSNFYDGIGAVNFWKIFYDFFSSIGFSKAPYIGVTINTMFVSLSGLFSLKIVKILYPQDDDRYIRFILLFSSCGLFMLFAALHLRDAFILFFVTLQAFAWVKFIDKKNLINFLLLLSISFVSSYALLYLRAEFLALSFGFFLAFLVSYLLTNNLSAIRRSLLTFFLSSIGLIALILIFNNSSTFTDLISASNLYAEAGKGSGSLGYDLIISQPLPIRLLLGSLMLFIMPIPVWSGIEMNSIYFLFKSLNAVYFYFMIPLILLSLFNFYAFRGIRNEQNYFLLFCILGFTSVVVLTSSENRHIGSFLPLFLLFSLIPSFNNRKEIKNYITLFLLFFSFILLLHSLWILIEYL